MLIILILLKIFRSRGLQILLLQFPMTMNLLIHLWMILLKYQSQTSMLLLSIIWLLFFGPMSLKGGLCSRLWTADTKADDLMLL